MTIMSLREEMGLEVQLPDRGGGRAGARRDPRAGPRHLAQLGELELNLKQDELF